MHFQLRTDNHLGNSEGFTDRVRATVEGALLPRFAGRLHRVEAYLQDTNAGKGGIDKRCSLEAHLAGQQPVAVHAEAADVDEAVTAAAEKLRHALEHVVGRLAERGRTSASGQQE